MMGLSDFHPTPHWSHWSVALFTRLLTIVAFAAATSSLVFAAEKDQKVNPTGNWRWTNHQTGEEDLLRLQLKSKGRIVGEYHSGASDKSFPVQEGRIDGNKFSCRLEIKADGGTVEVEVDAKIDGDQIEGTVHYKDEGGDAGHLDWTAKRTVKIEDAFGKWQLEFTSPDGREHSPVMHVKPKGDSVVVHMTDNDGDDKREAESAKFSGGELVATFKMDYDGQPLTASYRGRPRGYEFNGVIEYEVGGNEGEFEFEGSRETED